MPDKPGTIRPGASGMAQGRLAQLMARAYHRTGDHRFADAARGALASFTVPVARGGVVSEVADPAGAPKMPWYVERAYPGANPWKGAALNGFMVTLLNLHATAPLLRARPESRGGGPSETRTRTRAAGAQEAGDLALDLMRTGEQTLVALPAGARHRHLEPLRPAHAGPPVEVVPRRRGLPLLPRHAAALAGEDLARARLRRRSPTAGRTTRCGWACAASSARCPRRPSRPRARSAARGSLSPADRTAGGGG